MSPASQIYAKITGPIVMVGFGSIGKGTLPMIERHLDYDKSRITVIDPKDEGRKALHQYLDHMEALIHAMKHRP